MVGKGSGLPNVPKASLHCVYCDQWVSVYPRWPHGHDKRRTCPSCGMPNSIATAIKDGRWVEPESRPDYHFVVYSDHVRKCPQCGYAWHPRQRDSYPKRIRCIRCYREGRFSLFPAIYYDDYGRRIH